MRRVQKHLIKKNLALLIAAATASTANVSKADESLSFTLEEIVVTAEKREGTVQDTPIAMTAVGGDDLLRQSKLDVDEILQTMPSVEMQNTGGGPGVYIRGVGSNDLGFGEPSINFNIDGIYQQDARNVTMGTFDVNRIEVLRGPQGTLYGRNSTAGALNLITNSPDLSDFSGSVKVTAGNYDALRTELVLNAPLTEKVAIRGAFFTNEHDGYIEPTDAYDADQKGGRVKALFEVSDDLRIVLGYSSISIDEVPNPQLGAIYDTGGNLIPIDERDEPWYEINGDYIADRDGDFTTLSAQVDWRIGDIDVTAILANIEADVYTVTDDFDQDELTEQNSLEIRLSSTAVDNLEWVLGATYIDGDYDRTYPLGHGGPGPYGSLVLEQSQPVTSFGIFGQTNYAFTDTVRGVLGLRYSEDEKSQSNIYYDGATEIVSPDPVSSWDSLDYKIGVEVDVLEASLFYASVASGYKAGGFQTIAAAGEVSDSFDPEELLAFEMGLKSRLMDGRLIVNAAFYMYDYENYQVKFPEFSNPVAFAVRTENAGQADIKGIEIETSYALSESSRIDAFYTYTDGKFTDFSYTSVTPGGATLVDFSGATIPNAARNKFRLAYEYSWPINDNELSLRLETSLSSGFWTTHERTTDAYQESYHRSDVSFIYSNEAVWSARIYAKNIEDEAVRGGGGSQGVYLQQPRTYGVGIAYNF